MTTIYTIGHSNHGEDTFLSLLDQHQITAIADVRSLPYSRFAAQFNRETLAARLSKQRIVYVYLGDSLGARPDDPLCYRNGGVDFSLLRQRDSFQDGLARVLTGARRYNLAIMCSERDPIQCHRMILVCRHLRAHDTLIKHILSDGKVEDNQDAEWRLMELLKIQPSDLFSSPDSLVERAYDEQSGRISYQEDDQARRVGEFSHA